MGYVDTNKTSFTPSEAFPSCLGFHVVCEIESIDTHLADRSHVTARGWDDDGYEVVFNGKRKALAPMVGERIDVPGHAIMGYSGAMGAWAPARINRDRAKS